MGERITGSNIPYDHAGPPPNIYDYLTNIALVLHEDESEAGNYLSLLNVVDEVYGDLRTFSERRSSQKLDDLSRKKQAERLHDRELITGRFSPGPVKRLTALRCYRPYENYINEEFGTTIDNVIGVIDALADPIDSAFESIITEYDLLYKRSPEEGVSLILQDRYIESVCHKISKIPDTELDNLWFTEEELWEFVSEDLGNRSAFSDALEQITIELGEEIGRSAQKHRDYEINLPYRLPMDVGAMEEFVLIKDNSNPPEYFFPLLKRAYDAVLRHFWDRIDRDQSDVPEYSWGDYVEKKQ